MILDQTLKNLKRTREIIQILVKYGFEDIIAHSTLRNFVPEGKRLGWSRKDKPAIQYTRWERIRMAAEELGPTFVKLAQVLSIRPDILPEGLIKELAKLQDHVEPFDIEIVKKICREDTGKEVDEIFNNFNDKPLASASIGQVHRARLKTGEEVVVKFMRPDVSELVETDLAILAEAVRRTERYLKRQGIINAQDVVRAFDRSMHKELDYRNEARNIERFRKYYKSYSKFYIPKAYREISTDRMLVIEYADGCKIDDVVQQKAWGLDPRKVAENGMDIYLTQIFEHGYFHADPHPGNVFVRKDGVICLIDFGMTGNLMPKEKYAFAGIFISMAQQDAKSMAQNMRRMALEHQITDMRSLEGDLFELIEDYSTLDVSESSIADMIGSLQKIMFDYQIRMPGGIFLIFRAFAILEGIGKKVHPHFNTYEFIKPYGKRIIKEQYSAKNLISEFTYRANELGSLWGNLPTEIKSILQKARKGKLHFEVEHQGYGYLLKKLDSITNRLAITFIICALLIASSIAMTVTFPDQYMTRFGINYLSTAGIFTAMGLFALLGYAILRRRKYK